MSAIRRVLHRAQPGSRGGVEAHIRRAERLAALIADRWQIQRPEQWRAKHLRWALEHGPGIADAAPATRYHYYWAGRAVAAALGRWPDWEPHLRGPWQTPDGRVSSRDQGGRPARLAGRR